MAVVGSESTNGKFNFFTQDGVTLAFQRAAEFALDPEGVPQSNAITKSANGVTRLQEVKLKYEIFKLKYKGPNPPSIPLLEDKVQ